MLGAKIGVKHVVKKSARKFTERQEEVSSWVFSLAFSKSHHN